MLNGECQWRRGFWLPAALLAGLCAWCLYRAEVLPEPLATQFETMVRSGQPVLWIKDVDGVRQAQAWFALHYKMSAAWCGAGLVIWLVFRFGRLSRQRLAAVVGVLLLGDLLWFSHGRNYQCDPALYYPEIPALRAVAGAAPGRIIGYNCFPANLAEAVGLSDVRGYDGVDPAQWVYLVNATADEHSSKMDRQRDVMVDPPHGDHGDQYGATFSDTRYVGGTACDFSRVTPAGSQTGISESRLLGPGKPFRPATGICAPTGRGGDGGRRTARKTGAPEFNPREVAYVESPVTLPPECRGVVKIQSEIPTRIVVTAQMETPGLLVLADRWDQGWRAYLNGKPAPILKTNYALRGVVLPAGIATVEFRYQSAAVAAAFLLAAGALVLLLGWLAMAAWLGRKSPAAVTSEPPDEPDQKL